MTVLARPVLASFPLAALGALVIYAAVRLIDVRAFRQLAAFRISELVLALSACAGVLVFDILYGVLATVGLSVAELLLWATRTSRGIVFAIARVKQDLLDDLQAFGLAQKIGEQRIFPTLPTAVAAYRQWVKEHPQQGPDQARSESCPRCLTRHLDLEAGQQPPARRRPGTATAPLRGYDSDS